MPKTAKKVFVEGEKIIFQREPDAVWDVGEYVKPDPDPLSPGWHYVIDVTRDRTKRYVPTRRIRKCVLP
jgi:hypothetical protein